MNKTFKNSEAYMDYQQVYYAAVHQISFGSIQELTHRVLPTPGGNFPIYFFKIDGTMEKLPFVVHNLGFFTVGEHYYTRRDRLENYEFIFTTDGCGLIETDGKVYTCTRNSAILFDCRKPHYLHTYPGDTWTYKHLHFTAKSENSLLVEKALNFLPKMESMGNYVDLIMKQLAQNRLDAPFLINKYVVDLLTDMIIYNHSINGSSQMERRMSEISDYIQEHLAEELKIENLSNLVFLSPYYFSRQFKNYFGMSPYQYILQCRINKATLLLLQGKDVDTIIKDCGFGTPTNFYRRFKNMTGMTPAKFLKLNS